MMKQFLFILFILSSGISPAQELVETSLSSCDSKSYPEYIRDRLISKELKSDTLILKLGLVLNCCPSPKPSLTFKNDTLFIQITDTSHIFCACECCFELQLKATGIPDTNFILIQQFEASDLTNKGFVDWTEYRELKHHKNKYIFPDLEEINSFTLFNQTNEDGLKIGLWNIYYENSEKIRYKAYYSIESSKEATVLWSIMYNLDGEIIEVCAKTGKNESTCVEGDVYRELMNEEP